MWCDDGGACRDMLESTVFVCTAVCVCVCVCVCMHTWVTECVCMYICVITRIYICLSPPRKYIYHTLALIIIYMIYIPLGYG